MRLVGVARVVDGEFIRQFDELSILQAIKSCSKLGDIALVEAFFGDHIPICSDTIRNLLSRSHPLVRLGRCRECASTDCAKEKGEDQSLHFLENV